MANTIELEILSICFAPVHSINRNSDAVPVMQNVVRENNGPRPLIYQHCEFAGRFAKPADWLISSIIACPNALIDVGWARIITEGLRTRNIFSRIMVKPKFPRMAADMFANFTVGWENSHNSERVWPIP